MSKEVIMQEEFKERLKRHLEVIYPDGQIDVLAESVLSLFPPSSVEMLSGRPDTGWDQQDCFLITYGSSLRRKGEKPLSTLRDFLKKHLQSCFSGVHVLPFFPYTSDDGFAISDYEVVNPELGDWSDLTGIAEDFRLMADCVINHCSSSHPWFTAYQHQEPPYDKFFIEISPNDDLNQVARPRTSPLARPVPSDAGVKYVWCTFSHDQVDLNFGEPAVLLEMIRILAGYLQRGVRVIRLDAIAYLWKELGTRCLNHPKTHETVRLLRTLVDQYPEPVWLMTETNIPNHENLSYFGNGNEAHIIYNFSLPPLLLHAMLAGHCRHLKAWMMSMPPAQEGTTFFNFIASHDGIGLRPAEGLLEDQEMRSLVDTMERMGGKVSWRAAEGGIPSPYEINISLFDAFKATFESGVDEWHLDRYVCAHAILLAIEGIPGIYIHSLFGTPNDHALCEHTGHNRSINRHEWEMDQLESLLGEPTSIHSRIYKELLKLIALRRRQPAFHPNATQFTLHLEDRVFAFWRQSMRRDQSIFCLNNVSSDFIEIQLGDLNLITTDTWKDLISGEGVDDVRGGFVLRPYQNVWLSNKQF